MVPTGPCVPIILQALLAYREVADTAFNDGQPSHKVWEIANAPVSLKCVAFCFFWIVFAFWFPPEMKDKLTDRQKTVCRHCRTLTNTQHGALYKYCNVQSCFLK